jgi:hypothetical protein
MTAGYSGTPLRKKLGFKPGHRVDFHHMPAELRAELKSALAVCTDGEGELDLAIAFVKSHSELRKLFPVYTKRLQPAGILWISWPKKTSGIPSDLDENIIRKIGLEKGLVDVKVCAVSDIWSGLKFVRRLKDR